MTSFFPHSNRRPWMILTLSRTCSAAASTPRNGTLASVPVERLGRLMMTNNSADASGPCAVRATPGESAITRVASRPRPLTISLSAPLRRTMAASGEPDTVMACLNPAAMDRTPTSTATTPAMPMIVAVAAPRRCGMLINPNLVMDPAWESQLMGPAMSHPPQRVRHPQAHGLVRRKDSRHNPQHDADPQPRQQTRFGKHQRDDLSVGETDGLEHAQLSRPLAHRLGHRVAGHQQDREKHRAQDRRDDHHDVADLPGPRLHERALPLRL